MAPGKVRKLLYMAAQSPCLSCWTCHRGHGTPPKLPEDAQRTRQVKRMLEIAQADESKPADGVFHNIQSTKNVPAGKFLEIMIYFSQALGVHARTATWRDCGIKTRPPSGLREPCLAWWTRRQEVLRRFWSKPDYEACAAFIFSTFLMGGDFTMSMLPLK